MTTKAELLKAIRAHCIECCGTSPEVEKCASGPGAEPYPTCGLWAYRSGKDPSPAPSKVAAGKVAGETYGYSRKTTA